MLTMPQVTRPRPWYKS